MSDQPQAPDWEQDSDGKWYAPGVLGAAGWSLADDGRWHAPQEPSGEAQDLLTDPRPAGPAPKGLAAWWRESNWLARGLAIAVPVLLIAVIGVFAARASTQSNADALEADLSQSRSDIAAAEERIADLETQTEGTTTDNADQAAGYERLLDEASATLDELDTSPTTTVAPTTTAAPPTTAVPEPESGPIPGLTPVEVYGNFEDRGWECDDSGGDEYRIYTCNAPGSTSTVDVYFKDGLDVYLVEGNMDSPADYQWLGFLATVRFDRAEPDRARAWVEGNVAGAQEGTSIQEMFGGVPFQLGGVGQVRFLEIGDLP